PGRGCCPGLSPPAPTSSPPPEGRVRLLHHFLHRAAPSPAPPWPSASPPAGPGADSPPGTPAAAPWPGAAALPAAPAAAAPPELRTRRPLTSTSRCPAMWLWCPPYQ
ncbi:hypothetical protein AALO_G00097590, partial [Alosa alosa]